MSTTDHGPTDGFEPEREDWPAPDPQTLSPEAVENEPDDVVAGLPDDAPLPADADEADVLDQRTEAGLDVDETEDDDEV
ncbi:MAG: hypothetical protein WCA30_02025 [Dermatophilaceae bacterium]